MPSIVTLAKNLTIGMAKAFGMKNRPKMSEIPQMARITITTSAGEKYDQMVDISYTEAMIPSVWVPSLSNKVVEGTITVTFPPIWVED